MRAIGEPSVLLVTDVEVDHVTERMFRSGWKVWNIRRFETGKSHIVEATAVFKVHVEAHIFTRSVRAEVAVVSGALLDVDDRFQPHHLGIVADTLDFLPKRICLRFEDAKCKI